MESTIKSIGPSWDRVRGGTATIWFRRESVVWSGALRLRPIKRSSESRNPSVWRSGRLKTTRSVNAVRTARFEYRRWPPRRPFFGGTHAAIASSLSQIVTSPRLLRPRSYSLQFRILYFFLYWRLTRLDFAATMTLPPDLYDRLDPTPAASVLAYTDSCTNASLSPRKGRSPVSNSSRRLSGPNPQTFRASSTWAHDVSPFIPRPSLTDRHGKINHGAKTGKQLLTEGSEQPYRMKKT